MHNDHHRRAAYHEHAWRDRDRGGYAYHAGEPGPGPNFHRLRRDMGNRKIAGVCSGFARYFGWNVTALRIGWVIGAVVFTFPAFAYLFFAFLLKAEAYEPAARTPEEERFWRTFSVKPQATYSELRHRYRALDARVSDMERAVTSDEYGLRKAFRDLERGA